MEEAERSLCLPEDSLGSGGEFIKLSEATQGLEVLKRLFPGVDGPKIVPENIEQA